MTTPADPGTGLDLIAIIGLTIGAIGGIAGIISAFVAWKQWKKVNRKVAMLEDAEAVFEILPAWYSKRMMQDSWLFGLQTDDGRVLAIRTINAVSDDGVWMDVELATDDKVDHVPDMYQPLITAIAEDRINASIRISSIVAAYDLVTS